MRLLMCLVGLSAAACGWAGEPASENYRIPVDVFAGDLRGPYRTGTVEELWVDQQRDETATSDASDKRRLMVQIWYPAQFKGNPDRAPYALHRELYPKDEEARWLDNAQAVRTTSVLQAALVKEPGRLPVLIYNPGGNHPHFSATFQAEFLASHGYVVVAIGHTGLTRIERFPDGASFRPDREQPWMSEAQGEGLSEVEQFQLQRQQFAKLMMPVHVQDIRFVLDRLQSLSDSRGSPFYRRLDLDRVGSLGWSLGGALSVQVSRDEPRIKAAANLDGWLYTDVAETGTQRPIMQMHGDAGPTFRPPEQDAGSQELNFFADWLFWQLYARSKADWYDITLAGATHGHFSDRTLFEPAAVELMHPRLAHDIVNQFTLEFFDKYLRQRQDTPLLSGGKAYPNVAVVRRK